MARTISSPYQELIELPFGNSFAFKKFEEINPNSVPNWHFHPEVEIVYIKNGSGKRHIGSHVSYYNSGDLIIIGPNLPHYGFTDRLTGDAAEIVVQFKVDFLGVDFFTKVEMQSIYLLLERSKNGISFTGNTKDEVGSRLNSMFYMNPFERLLALLNILNIMGTSKEYELLNAQGISLVINGNDNQRIDLVYNYVRENFTEPIKLEDVASMVNMAVPSFCRYFKKVTSKTFIEFVNDFRIVHACKLLNEERHNITEVCFESGFNNFSHFNRLFKSKTGKSPNEYRKSIEKVVSEEYYIG